MWKFKAGTDFERDLIKREKKRLWFLGDSSFQNGADAAVSAASPKPTKNTKRKHRIDTDELRQKMDDGRAALSKRYYHRRKEDNC